MLRIVCNPSIFRKMTFYEILRIPQNATFDSIESAFYERLADDENITQGKSAHEIEEINIRSGQIIEAYQVLSDQRLRTLYDEGKYDSLSLPTKTSSEKADDLITDYIENENFALPGSGFKVNRKFSDITSEIDKGIEIVKKLK